MSTEDEKKTGASTSKQQFNCGVAMFRSIIKKQRMDPETSKKVEQQEVKPAEVVVNENNDEELRLWAIDRLKSEAVAGAERVKTMGVQGWVKPRKINKQFLTRTVQSTKMRLPANKKESK